MKLLALNEKTAPLSKAARQAKGTIEANDDDIENYYSTTKSEPLQRFRTLYDNWLR